VVSREGGVRGQGSRGSVPLQTDVSWALIIFKKDCSAEMRSRACRL